VTSSPWISMIGVDGFIAMLSCAAPPRVASPHMARAAKPALKIGTSAFVFPIAIARRLRPPHTADLLGEQLLNSRSDRIRFRRWLGLLGHGDLYIAGGSPDRLTLRPRGHVMSLTA
jgi:hypothetical protein